MTVPVAHETWFTEGHRTLEPSFAGEPATLALLAGAAAVTLAARAVSRMWSGVDVPWLARLAPWMPFAVRLHLAVSLLGLLSLGFYLSPDMDLQADVPGVLLGAVMAVVAIGMVTGYRTREAAWLLVAAGPLGVLEFGVAPVLQRVDVLGLAAFLLVAGPGPWSADAERGLAAPFSPAAEARAVWCLRVAAGTSLVLVAFYEKLANPDLAVAFLTERPEFNVPAELGLDVSHREFARLAGTVEVLFGLLLLSGALPQLAVLLAGVPFNATLWFFGANELMGHLPVYAAMLVLLVLGSDPRRREAVQDLWPFGTAARRRAASRLPVAAAGGDDGDRRP